MKNRKIKKELLLLSLALVCLSGCGNTGEPDKLGNDQVSLSVRSASLQQLFTRASSNLESGSIGVFLASDNGYTAQNNVEYTYNVGWSTSTPILLGNNQASVCAYYPYSASVTDASSVALVSGVYSLANDLCYASTQQFNNESSDWEIAMSRAYSQISLNVTRDASYMGACAISSVKIANAGLYGSATLNIATGEYANPMVSEVSYDPEIASIGAGATVTTSALVVPVGSAMSGDLLISLVVDGVSLSAQVDVSANNLTLLQAGTRYVLNLNVAGESLLIGGVSVTDWDVNEIPGSTDLLPSNE